LSAEHSCIELKDRRDAFWKNSDEATISFNSPAKSIRIDNVPNRTIGLCAEVLYKQRMISST
jgi:hypothetical protein